MTKIDEMMTLIDLDFINQKQYEHYMKARSAVYNAQRAIDHSNTTKEKITRTRKTKWSILYNLALALSELSNCKTDNGKKAYKLGEEIIKEYFNNEKK